MLCKIIALKEKSSVLSRAFFFSGQDRKTASQLITALDNTRTPQQLNGEITDFINKGQHWLVNGIQRFNLDKILYLTKLYYAFALSKSLKQKRSIAENIKHFIAEINTQDALEINIVLLLTPCRIIAAYRAKDYHAMVEALNDYRQSLEQPRYARGLLRLNRLSINRELFQVIDAAALSEMLQKVSERAALKPLTLLDRARRIYRNIRPLIRDASRLAAGLSLAAAFFTLFPAVDFPLPHVILVNACLNLFTNSAMLWISARGPKFWQYRFADLILLKLSQSVMYSSLGLPLTQTTAYLCKNLLAGGGNLLLANTAALFGVGIVGAAYTFFNNKIRGKNALETKLNILRPIFGSASALGMAAVMGGIPQNYLTIVSMIMGNVYRLVVEGTINYALYKRFIERNLKALRAEGQAEEKLIKFNIEAMSFIANPGGASSVQSYLHALEPLWLIKLFRSLGQDRSRHLANIQNYSYADSSRAEYYFTNAYFVYRKMLALAICAAGKITKSHAPSRLDTARPEISGLQLRLKRIPAAKMRALREEAVDRSLAQIQAMTAEQINAAARDLFLMFRQKSLPLMRKYFAALTEEQIILGLEYILEHPAAEPLAAQELWRGYAATLRQKTKTEEAKHIIYRGLR